MGEDFFDWLDSCPVQWFRIKEGPDSSTYEFIKPEEEE